MGFVDSLLNYLLLASPYLLIGLVFSGFIHSFLDVNKIKSWLGRGSLKDVWLASFLGVPLPLCSCSVIPTAVTLRKSGASPAATSSFLISTPESGVDSILVTYALMDFPMTLIRPLAAFFSAFLAGVLQLIFNSDHSISSDDQAKANKHEHCHTENSHPTMSLKSKLKSGFRYAFVDLIDDLALWLSLGILLGALLDYVIPADFFLNFSPWQGKALILFIGIPLYICASATTPIAASLVMKGLSPGAALILLLVGPATNLSNLFVLQKYIGKKGIFLNIISIASVALIFSIVLDYLYLEYFSLNWNIEQGHQHSHSKWWEIASAVVIVLLLVKGVYMEEIKPRLHKKEAKGCCH